MYRLILPVILLFATAATFVAADNVGQDEVPPVQDPVEVVSPITPVFSVRRAPGLLAAPGSTEELADGLNLWREEFEATLPDGSRYCLSVSSGVDNLYGRNVDEPLSPASNLKLITAAAAWLDLGPDYTYSTKIYAEQEPVDGVLNGDLYVVGGGDPILTTDPYQETLDEQSTGIRTAARDIADSVIALTGLFQLNGGVRVADDRYDDERAVPTWPDRFLTQGQVGPLGALVIDDGFAGWPDAYPDPDSDLARIPVEDPALQAAGIIDDLLEVSVTVAGSPGRAEEGFTTESLVELASVESVTMDEIIKQMLIGSDNNTAELLLKELGVAAGLSGSTASGYGAAIRAIGEANVNIEGLEMVDGSGLSIENEVSCATLSSLLSSPQLKPMFRESLPVAGQSGTLIDTFAETPVAGRLRAKTGFLNSVAALSGYLDTSNGAEVTFSFLINTPPGISLSETQIVDWQLPMLRTLLTYPTGPSLDNLGPTAVAGQRDEGPGLGPIASGVDAEDEVDAGDGTDAGGTDGGAEPGTAGGDEPGPVQDDG